MEINVTRLQGNITNPITDNNVSYPSLHHAYQINPRWDEITITMEDFDKFKPSWVGGSAIKVNLTKVKIRYIKDFSAGLGQPPQFYDLGKTPGIDYDNYIWVNGVGPSATPIEDLQDNKNITFRFPSKFFYSAADAKVIYINMSFRVGMQPGEIPMHYLNTSRSPPWSTTIIQPKYRNPT